MQWGIDEDSIEIVAANMIRYRGYYFDLETGFYYLNSRYYDPNIRRFVSADDISYLGANDDMSAFNLYAYCSNNPVMYKDPSGNFAITTLIIILAITGSTVAFGVTAYADYKDDGEIFNGSVTAGEYIVNTLVGGGIGVAVGYLGPQIGSLLSSVPALFGGGGGALAFAEVGSVVIGGAQTLVAGGIAVVGAGILFRESNKSGKERSSEHPSWVNRNMVDPNKSAQQNATDILNNKYGKGNWKTGPGSEFNRLVKWISRHVFKI